MSAGQVLELTIGTVIGSLIVLYIGSFIVDLLLPVISTAFLLLGLGGFFGIIFLVLKDRISSLFGGKSKSA